MVWVKYAAPAVQMVVKQPALVVREGAVEESRQAAASLRQMLQAVDVDRWGQCNAK